MDHRAGIPRGEDVVDAVAGGAVRDRLGARPQGQAVVAVLEGRDAVHRQVVARREALVAVTAPAGDARDSGRVHERSGLLRGEDRVLAVAVGADGDIANASGSRLAVNTARVAPGDLAMATTARLGHARMVDPRRRLPGGNDVV